MKSSAGTTWTRAALALTAALATALTIAGPAGATPGASPDGLPSGDITTIAGGFGGPGPATQVPLDQIAGCFGMQISGGQLYLTGGGRERAINVRTGQLTSVAPQLAPSFETGDAGPTLLIEHSPCSAVVDSHGNLVVASRGLRVVAAKTGTFYGQAMTAGQVYRVMQSDACHGSPFDLACAVDVVIDHSGNLIVSFSASHSTKHPGPADINVAPARSGTFYGRHMTVGHTYRLNTGGGGQVAVDRSGNLLVAGDGQNQVGVIAERTGRFYGRAMTAGKLYNLAGTGAAGFSGDGGPAVRAKLNGPQALAVDGPATSWSAIRVTNGCGSWRAVLAGSMAWR